MGGEEECLFRFSFASCVCRLEKYFFIFFRPQTMIRVGQNDRKIGFLRKRWL